LVADLERQTVELTAHRCQLSSEVDFPHTCLETGLQASDSQKDANEIKYVV
jgi:hypothetical protein